MANYVENCAAQAEAAGWSGDALVRLVVDPKSATPEGFRAQLAEANEIRGLVRILAPDMRALGYELANDPESAAAHFVAQGYSLKEIREDTNRVLVEHDEATTIDTTPRARGSIKDPYAARVAEIDAYKGKAP